MRKAVALLAYARPECLHEVWASLAAQRLDGRALAEQYAVCVSHDGLWSDEDAATREGHAQVRAWLDRLPPTVRVFRHSVNLGIARHYDFIEKQLFVQEGYDFVVLCEDDLVLAPGYVAAVDRMAALFHDDHRVGMMSAHPADPTLPLDVQRRRIGGYTSMGHNWAYGISRSFWQRRQPLVEAYLDLVRGQPYRRRDHALVFEWLARIGFAPRASSQDYVKTCATYALGAVKLAPWPNLGRPIGRSGVHCTPELFARMGLDRAVVFDGAIDTVPTLSDRMHGALWRRPGHQVEARRVHVIREPATHDPTRWEERLRAGEFAPSRVLPDVLVARARERAGGVPLARMQPCPCQSGRRWKDCHGRLVGAP